MIDLADALRDHALAEAPNEAVALLLGLYRRRKLRIETFVRMGNAHESPESNFLIHPLDLLRTEEIAAANGCTIVGVCHSHVNGTASPSRADIEMMRSPHVASWWWWPIYSVQHDRFRVWQLDENGEPRDLNILG